MNPNILGLTAQGFLIRFLHHLPGLSETINYRHLLRVQLQIGFFLLLHSLHCPELCTFSGLGFGAFRRQEVGPYTMRPKIVNLPSG